MCVIGRPVASSLLVSRSAARLALLRPGMAGAGRGSVLGFRGGPAFQRRQGGVGTGKSSAAEQHILCGPIAITCFSRATTDLTGSLGQETKSREEASEVSFSPLL